MDRGVAVDAGVKRESGKTCTNRVVGVEREAGKGQRVHKMFVIG